MEILKNGILKIKFELLEFLENYLKNGILKIKFKNLNFGKLNLKKNEILENWNFEKLF